MARDDKAKQDIKRAYGRYSASDQADKRRRDEQRDHGVYGYPPDDTPGQERDGTARKAGASRRPRKPARPSSRNSTVKR